jgi:hypothetical protein
MKKEKMFKKREREKNKTGHEVMDLEELVLLCWKEISIAIRIRQKGFKMLKYVSNIWISSPTVTPNLLQVFSHSNC